MNFDLVDRHDEWNISKNSMSLCSVESLLGMKNFALKPATAMYSIRSAGSALTRRIISSSHHLEQRCSISIMPCHIVPRSKRQEISVTVVLAKKGSCGSKRNPSDAVRTPS